MSKRYQFLAQAKLHFVFLAPLGFRIKSEHEGTYSSFKDGFAISYASKDVNIRVAYYDMEFTVVLKRGRVEADYLFLDHNLRANASGLAGNMFPFEKLSPVITNVAKDLELHYQSVLQGDDVIWQKINRLLLAPREKK